MIMDAVVCSVYIANEENIDKKDDARWILLITIFPILLLGILSPIFWTYRYNKKFG
jgi:hypothetical protein